MRGAGRGGRGGGERRVARQKHTRGPTWYLHMKEEVVCQGGNLKGGRTYDISSRNTK